MDTGDRALCKRNLNKTNLEKDRNLTKKKLQSQCCRLFSGLAVLLPQLLVLPPIQAQSNKSLVSQEPAETRITSSTAEKADHIVSELKQLQNQIKTKSYPISLAAAVATGLKNNPELLKAYSTIQQFEWKLIAAKRQWYPTLQLQNGNPFVGVSWESYINDNYASSRGRLQELGQERKTAKKTQQSIVTPGVITNWNVIDPTRQPNINAAANALEQQKYLFDVSARNLILNIEKAYFSLQSTQQLIESFQKIYEINKEQLDILEARSTIGMVTVLEVEQTRSQLFTELNKLILYTKDYIRQAAELAQRLALPRDQLALPSDPAGLQNEWEASLDDTISLALEQREEILSSLAAAEAAEWSAVAAIRSYLPVFSLVASGNLRGWNGYESVAVPEDPGDDYARNRAWSASVGIGFSWSIFDGGVQAANSQAAKAQSREQKAQAASTEFQVIKQVRSSYGQMKTALVAVESAEQSYQSAQLAQAASRARFQVGIGDITSVVQTIDQLSTASRQRSVALLEYNNAVAELYRFSATWPSGTQQELQNRIKLMRNNQPPATPTSTGAAQ